MGKVTVIGTNAFDEEVTEVCYTDSAGTVIRIMGLTKQNMQRNKNSQSGKDLIGSLLDSLEPEKEVSIYDDKSDKDYLQLEIGDLGVWLYRVYSEKSTKKLLTSYTMAPKATYGHVFTLQFPADNAVFICMDNIAINYVSLRIEETKYFKNNYRIKDFRIIT